MCDYPALIRWHCNSRLTLPAALLDNALACYRGSLHWGPPVCVVRVLATQCEAGSNTLYAVMDPDLQAGSIRIVLTTVCYLCSGTTTNSWSSGSTT